VQNKVVVGAVGSGNCQLCGTLCSGLRWESRSEVVGSLCLAVPSVAVCRMLLCYVVLSPVGDSYYSVSAADVWPPLAGPV
jgi:hypothetical protein